jgi:hypothetical protein
MRLCAVFTIQTLVRLGELMCKDVRFGDLGRVVRLLGPRRNEYPAARGRAEFAPHHLGASGTQVVGESGCAACAVTIAAMLLSNFKHTHWSRQALDRVWLCRCDGTLRNGLEIEYSTWWTRCLRPLSTWTCRFLAEFSALARPVNPALEGAIDDAMTLGYSLTPSQELVIRSIGP